MVNRKYYLQQVQQGLVRSPIVALLGPRQCGKTTLARQLVHPEASNYFDLEDPTTALLMENPMTALSPLKGTVVIDEAQRQPGIFPVLRVLADRENRPATFLILGSASPDLSRQASESLAGRVEIINMRGFDLSEIHANEADQLWFRGGFPRSFLAASNEDSLRWRRDFIRTFLERDLAQAGFGMNPSAIGRFWSMVSHYHAQIWNGSEIAASLGIAPNTARSYLDALEQTFMIRRLQPWYENTGKRLVKTPKIYFRDSGLFHALQGVTTPKELQVHPKLGASWEGFALEETLHALNPLEAYFYTVHSGAELDLFLLHEGKRLGIEFKRQDAPKMTRSMHIAIDDLKLDALWIIYPGQREYALSDRVLVRPLSTILTNRSHAKE
ncbi:MAG: ATP-binding protein [Kiritimatiellaceae bacterium]|nr:ATP-binding protein [Kiritimatiellaceae bacterium]